jgi:hypothetical protein
MTIITIISKSEQQQHDNDKVVIVNVSNTSSWQQQQEQKNIMQCNYNFMPIYAFMILRNVLPLSATTLTLLVSLTIIISFAMVTLRSITFNA